VASNPGTVTCKAVNEVGKDSTKGHVKIGDHIDPFGIVGIDDEDTIAAGDEVKLVCIASIYTYINKITWMKDGNIITQEDNFDIKYSSTDFSFRSTITFNEISKNDDGTYECEVMNKSNQNETEIKRVDIKVNDALAPVIISNFNQSRITQPFGGFLVLECLTTGLPHPKVTW
jgi:hypothetical protein